MKRRAAKGQRASLVGILVNLVLALLKGGAGVAAGSTALLVDAGHSAGDALASGALLVGFSVARRPADSCHPYGHGKAETIAGKVVAVLLILAGLNIGLWSLRRALVGFSGTAPGPLALAAAAFSILVKEGMFHYHAGAARRIASDALLASAWEQRADSLSSVAALLGVAGARAGFSFLDPLAGALVAAMVVGLGYRLFRKFADELMDKFDHPELIRAIAEAVAAMPGAPAVHSIRARHVGHEILVDLKIGVDPALSVAAGHAIAHQAREVVMKRVEEVADVMVHVDPGA
ncbi:MAG: cation diffusion facilitator family transporter [bacterium]|nr:cation diffusion facilitator family transporter [bacterium]